MQIHCGSHILYYFIHLGLHTSYTIKFEYAV